MKLIKNDIEIYAEKMAIAVPLGFDKGEGNVCIRCYFDGDGCAVAKCGRADRADEREVFFWEVTDENYKS